jgi:predicted nucleic acid-binding protein
MILYLDANALVKRYVAEPGSAEVAAMILQADFVGSALISRAEIAAALAKAVRVGSLSAEGAWNALKAFRRDWPDIVRLAISEQVVVRADTLAWEYGLRGYDAVHLAVATIWQEDVRQRVTLVSYDRLLWDAAVQMGFEVYPPDLPAVLASWKTDRMSKS